MGGLDLDSRSSGCARLGGGVGPPLGVVVEFVGHTHKQPHIFLPVPYKAPDFVLFRMWPILRRQTPGDSFPGPRARAYVRTRTRTNTAHMAQKPVLRGEVGCACVAREISVERGGMGSNPPTEGWGAREICCRCSDLLLKTAATSTSRSSTRGLARALTPRSSGCWLLGHS